MKLVIGIILLVANQSFGQTNPISISRTKEISIDINSKAFTRVFDGFQLKEDTVIKTGINSILRLSDTTKLKKMGLKDFRKPYMFLNTFPSEVRAYIYSKTNPYLQSKQINLPIILNNELITPDKYAIVDKIDIHKIDRIKYVTADNLYSKNMDGMPLGAVEVYTK